ncbi:MAG TPA: UDP-N-acetylglucosamine 2-epimerase [Chitinophagaceae bacterium]|nr:UDP-N-acetylglucosamine 2-epimerase [Chitinophagaceae bacterium]
MKKKIIFLTGTRADFGKLKSLIEILHRNELFEVHIFATGMHMDEKYGFTVKEIEAHGYPNIFKYINHDSDSVMDMTLGRTIHGFASYVHLIKPDLIVVHGDRIEALAGASVGSLNNILVAHVEGGEVSGTVDELLRHAVSKLSHLHFVANDDAKKRLVQMGEIESNVYVIGSPDMDVMLSKKLPGFKAVAEHYDIPFKKFALSLFHPVTTEVDLLGHYAKNYFDALQESGLNYIIIYPNNDNGSQFIMQHIRECRYNNQFKVYPSIRFEAFLTLIKNSQFIIGNSSAGIREAPYYGVSTVNVGTRQYKRSNNPDIIHTSYSKPDILSAIQTALAKKVQPRQLFGTGNSDVLFAEILCTDRFWQTGKQKLFSDIL